GLSRGQLGHAVGHRAVALGVIGSAQRGEDDRVVGRAGRRGEHRVLLSLWRLRQIPLRPGRARGNRKTQRRTRSGLALSAAVPATVAGTTVRAATLVAAGPTVAASTARGRRGGE